MAPRGTTKLSASTAFRAPKRLTNPSASSAASMCLASVAELVDKIKALAPDTRTLNAAFERNRPQTLSKRARGRLPGARGGVSSLANGPSRGPVSKWGCDERALVGKKRARHLVLGRPR